MKKIFCAGRIVRGELVSLWIAKSAVNCGTQLDNVRDCFSKGRRRRARSAT